MRKNIYIPDDADTKRLWIAFARLCKRQGKSVSERLVEHIRLDLRADHRRKLLERGAVPPIAVPPNLIIQTPEETDRHDHENEN